MSEISIQFLGTGDAFGSGGRLQTCIYVDSGVARFLIDCGATSLSAMRRWGVDPVSVDVILLTHLHGDHFGGLPFLILDAQLVSKRTQPLFVAGPAGTACRVRDAQEIFFPGSSHIELGFPISYLEWADAEPVRLGSLSVTPHQVIHASGAPAFALRIECLGKVISYSGDTEWTEALLSVADGADLFICEAYFFDKKVKFHLDYRTLTAHQTALGCKRLILTHMNDDLLSRLEGVSIECAEDGKRIIL